MKPIHQDVSCSSYSCFGPESAFPDRGNPPTRVPKRPSNNLVPLHIRLEFGQPEIGTRCWSSGVSTFSMTMPETAMNKYDSLMLRHHDIRLSRNALGMQAVSEA